MLTFREWSLRPDGRLHIEFIDVGQGDGALITFPSGKRMVIDGGPDWSLLEHLGARLPFFDRRIDIVALSHVNVDHLVSLPNILKRYRVRALLVSGEGAELPWWKTIKEEAERQNITLLHTYAGQKIRMESGASLLTLWPPKHMPPGFNKNLNNASLVLRLDFRDHQALFMGDSESIVEKTLLEARVNVRSELLKIGHHGSITSSSVDFLRAVSPKVAVISVGRENVYGHPRPEVLERLQELGVEIRRTDMEGTVEIVWE